MPNVQTTPSHYQLPSSTTWITAFVDVGTNFQTAILRLQDS